MLPAKGNPDTSWTLISSEFQSLSQSQAQAPNVPVHPLCLAGSRSGSQIFALQVNI